MMFIVIVILSFLVMLSACIKFEGNKDRGFWFLFGTFGMVYGSMLHLQDIGIEIHNMHLVIILIVSLSISCITYYLLNRKK